MTHKTPAPLPTDGAYGPNGAMRNTHLLDWLVDAYMHCQRGSRDWCEGYLANALSVIKAQDAEIDSLRSRCETLERENAKLEIDVRDYRQFSIDYAVERDKATAAESRLARAEAALERQTRQLKAVEANAELRLQRLIEANNELEELRTARSLSHGEDKTDG